MKNLSLVLLFALFSGIFVSCAEGESSEDALNEMVEAQFNEKKAALEVEANQACEDRMATDLNAAADSILATR